MSAAATMPRRRQKPVDREGAEQRAYFEWLQLQHPEAYEHAFHPPNGGPRRYGAGGKLKGQGAKAGVPDIFIDLPRGQFHGLRIELKATPPHDADPTRSQLDWLERLSAAGYRAVLCTGLDAAMEETDSYLRQPPPIRVTRRSQSVVVPDSGTALIDRLIDMHAELEARMVGGAFSARITESAWKEIKQSMHFTVQAADLARRPPEILGMRVEIIPDVEVVPHGHQS